MSFHNTHCHPLTQRSARSMKSQDEYTSVCFKTDHLESFKSGVMPSYNGPMYCRQQNQWTKDEKVIKFTGNMRENINQLLRSLECKCGAKQDYAQILFTYGDKITKLREERAKYKENSYMLKKQLQAVQEQIVYRNKQMEQLQENYYISRRDSVSKSQVDKKLQLYQNMQAKNQTLQQTNEELKLRLKQSEQECQHLTKKLLTVQKQALDRNLRPNKDQTCLLDLSLDPTQQGSLRQSSMMIKLERYENLFRQLPMEFDEVAKMLREYATDLPCFASRQQRELYFMATRMNSNLWKKKLQIQIKDLCEKRQALKKEQGDVDKRKSIPLQPIVNRKCL